MKKLALFAALALAACGNAGGRGAYDASRDAAADIKNALASAKASHKRVLIEAGGNWCSWCRIMDRYFEEHAGLAALRDKNFVTVRVNVESGGPLPGALKAYPAPAGFPHIYILDENGSLIQSQNTGELESGQSYDLEKFTFFLNAFAPPKT
ncbi:MAG: thioredoxin family protein [Elusimicrobia bacterium]|nr:thioredoxin family protein [Elusimicrobiota bacterium]